jgi:hypothetical protein
VRRWRRAERAALAGAMAVLALPALAQSPPRGPSAEAVVLALLLGYDGKSQPQPEQWPLVPRLRDALRRTDLGSDVLTGERHAALGAIVVDAAEMTDKARARVTARYRLDGVDRMAFFDLDQSEGQWLITDIRPASGPSFRQMLQLSR